MLLQRRVPHTVKGIAELCRLLTTAVQRIAVGQDQLPLEEPALAVASEVVVAGMRTGRWVRRAQRRHRNHSCKHRCNDRLLGNLPGWVRSDVL